MEGQENASFITPMGLGRMVFVQMAVRAAIELKVFDIIGPDSQLSCAEILSKIPTKNPDALSSLERILRMLGVHSILSMSTNQDGVIYYGLTPESFYLTTSPDGFSLSALVMFPSERESVESLYMIKDTVLKPGCVPVFKAYHGETLFEYASKNQQFESSFNKLLMCLSSFVIDTMLDNYDGFESVTELMDVGGNLGGDIEKIISRNPHIRGINFDMPHVIANAKTIQGVKNVGGDMFESLPKAETIFMKIILHDWNDVQCIKIMKNCWNSLPKNGKVISTELIVPEILQTNEESANVITLDFTMMLQQEGRERTKAEFEVLAKEAGFVETKFFPIALGFHVMEFIK